MLVGTTTEEYRFFVVPSGVADATTDGSLRRAIARRDWPSSTADLYTANRPGASPGDVLSAVVSDQYFRVPALVGDRPPQELADDMHGRRVMFAATGWPAYHPDSRAVLAFGSPASTVGYDPRPDERRLWDGAV